MILSIFNVKNLAKAKQLQLFGRMETKTVTLGATMRDNNKYFTVTEDHLKLLKRLCFRYDDYVEFGAPAVDPKRPYGNSSVYEDLGEILDWEPADEDRWGYKSYSDIQRERLLKLHKSMVTVLEILVTNNGVEVGEYETSRYGSVWRRVS